jgi:TP901 family phage tail tape measure protein
MAQSVVINFNANANFSDLISEIRKANAEIGTLQAQLNGLGSGAFVSIDNLNKQFIQGMRNSRLWSSSFVDVTNQTREFGKHLDQGRLKLRDYYREFTTQARGQRGLIRRLAEDQVKLQKSVLTTSIGPGGDTRSILSTPTGLDKFDPAVMKSLRAEQFKIIGRSIQGASTELINLGKNTQWAGRQLTVGLTVPLTMFAGSAANAFKEVDKQLTRLAKVYGDVGGATASEIANIKTQTMDLAKSLASDLGASVQDTIGLAADIAATGATGEDLIKSVAETTRLAVLGEVDRQEAMAATLSLQNAFNLNTKELAESINFLNAVENQTSTSLNDLVIAIPKAGPVVRQLGGDVKDLALFLTAMREGGINASESANALKSGLASIINPTQKTTEVLNQFGVNIEGIVNANAGDLVQTVIALKDELNNLDPLARARAIEQLFGKFQFARMSALFDNLGKSGSQTLQVIELMGSSTAELAQIADRELSILTESASGRFQRQIETFKANLAGVGEGFLQVFSTVLAAVNKLLDGFNNLPDGVKNVLTIVGALIGLVGPLIMLSGVFLNFFGFLLKSVGVLGRLFTGTPKFQLLTEEIMATSLSSEKMSNSFYDQALAAETARKNIDNLINSLKNLNAAQGTAMSGAAQKAAGAFIPKPMFQSGAGVMPAGIEYSHGVSKSARVQLAAQLGLTAQETQLLGGTGLSGLSSLTRPMAAGSAEAQLQQNFAERMPNFIVPVGTTAEQMRARLEPLATTERSKESLMRIGPDITKAFQTSEDYAQTQAIHVANLKAISQAYSRSAKDGTELANAMKKAWQQTFSDTGDEVAAARAAAEVAKTELGSGYTALVRKTSREISTAFSSGGADAAIIAGAKAELAAMRGGLLSGGAAKTTVERISRMSLAIAQGGVMNEIAVYQKRVTASTKEFGRVAVQLLGDTAIAFNAAGRELTAQEMADDAKVSAAIAQLKSAKIKADQAVVQDIQEKATALQIVANTAATGGASEIAMAGGARGGRFGKFRGMGASMGMMGLGIAASAIPQTGTAGNIAGGALMGASMGMMFGPIGAAVGASLGALIPTAKALWTQFDRLRDIVALNVRQYEIDKEFAKAAGLTLKTIGDIQLQQIVGKSAEAASQLELLAQAALSASTNLSTGALREKTKGAQDFASVSGEFQSQYLTYIAAGAAPEVAKTMMAAILKAAGKEGFATDLNMMLNGLSGQTQSSSVSKMLSGIASIRGTGYEGALNNPALAGLDRQMLGRIAQGGQGGVGFTNDQDVAISKLTEEYRKLTTAQKEAATSTITFKQEAAILNNALANQDLKTFAETMNQAAKSGKLTSDGIKLVADSISGLQGSERTVLDGLTRNGVDASDVMLALKMRIEGLIPSLQSVKDFDGMKIRATFELLSVRKELADAQKNLESSLQGMFSSSGAKAGNNDAAKKAIQAQIDALDEIERKEKNINKLKELRIKYEEKLRNLSVDYLSALSSGDLEGALRAQLAVQQEQAQYASDNADLQKEIAREDRKKALQDKLKSLDNTPSAVSGTNAKFKQMQTNIDEAIKKVVSGFKEGGEIGKTLSDFTNSDSFKNFEKQFKGVLSPEAFGAAASVLKSALGEAKGLMDVASSGMSGQTGSTRSSARDISSILGFQKNPNEIRKLTGAEEQEIISRGGLVANEMVKAFGYIYRYDLNKKDLINTGPIQKKFAGGKIRGYAGGGYITGFGSSVADNIPLFASNKEFMMSAKAVSNYGVPFMESINRLQYSPGAPKRSNLSQSNFGSSSVNVYVNKIDIVEPGADADTIIATMEKKLFASVGRSKEPRYLSI